MTIKLTRRHLLAGSAAALAMPSLARAQGAKPRVTAISQWSAGSDGAAISALGKVFEDRGGVWQHNPVPGFTTDMMNKLRAQIMAGDPPAISQLKGPEIAAWSKIAPTVDISPLVKTAGYADKVSAELAKSLPAGRPLDRAAAAGLSAQHAVHVHQGHGTGQDQQAAGHLGRVQRSRGEDEGRRHDPGGQWRQPPGRWPEIRDCARRNQSRDLSPRAHATRARRLEQQGSTGGLRTASQVFQLYEPEHRSPALGREPAGLSSRATWAW